MRRTGRKFLAMLLPIIILFGGVRTHAEYRGGDRGEDGVKVSSRFIELILGKDGEESEEIRLTPGGDVFGARIYQGYVSVKEECAELSLASGDIVKAIDGKEVLTLPEALGAFSLESDLHKVELLRGNKAITVEVGGQESLKKLRGVLCDGVAGIGTVTYIDPSDMSFGGLGHGICDDTGAVIPTKDGRVTGVIIGGAIKGERGQPGELSGILTDRGEGEIYSNTPCGVFGRLTKTKLDKSSSLPIAKRDEVKAGEATIISTVKNGRKAEYKVELFDIKVGETGTKCFKIRVTDKTLLALTGGIVRGMSGSPIIQDGKLVGAVTHVMVANPTEGYGIFIENMLSASESGAQSAPKAA